MLSTLKWRFSPFKGHTEKKLNRLQAGDNLLLRSVFDQAKGKIGHMEKPREPEPGTETEMETETETETEPELEPEPEPKK